MSLINLTSTSMVLRIFLLSVGVFSVFNSLAVTNQELMDRLDDIEFEQQNRELNRQLDELLMQQMRNSRASSTPSINLVTKKTEGNYKKISDGEVLRWMGDKECYASWDKELKLIATPIKNYKFKEIIQVDSLIAIVYFPNNFNDAKIRALFNKEGFFKLKALCGNR